MPAISYDERCRIMVEKYGEVCTKAAAGRIMGRDPRTIGQWIRDGRIDDACAGTMVDVRSLARYLTAPKQEDFEARMRKRVQQTGCEFYV